jgi:serine/threonine protein kinase
MPANEVTPTLVFNPLADGECPRTPLPAHFSFFLPPSQPGELGLLGDYRILRLLGTGGTAYVFEAEDLALQRRVALKVLRPDIRDAETSRRFLREARALAALKHPNIVTVYQAGEQRGVAFLAMELLEGETLDSWLRNKPPFDLADALRIACQLADGLSFLHEQGLLHRDIKPANIWLEVPHRDVKILDFGLVRPVESGPRLTEAGLALGTPGYMSPEQARGLPLDERSDIFSLGCVLYQVCTGREPFPGSTTMAVLSSLALDRPPSCHQVNPEVPPELAALIDRMLEKNPQSRVAQAKDVLDQLHAIQCRALLPPPVLSHDQRRRQQSRLEPPQVIQSTSVDQSPVAPEQPVGSNPTVDRTLSRPCRSRRWRSVLVATALIATSLVTGSAIWFGRRPSSALRGSDTHPEGLPVFLRTLPLVGRSNWPYYPPPLADGTVPGASLEVQGRPTPNGIFMHPPSRWSEEAGLTVALDRQFRRFHAQVSLTDGTPGSESPCTFRVLGDGKELWRSHPVHRQTDQQSCVVDVTGVERLELRVSCSGPSHGAFAVWIEPYVTR